MRSEIKGDLKLHMTYFRGFIILICTLQSLNKSIIHKKCTFCYKCICKKKINYKIINMKLSFVLNDLLLDDALFFKYRVT